MKQHTDFLDTVMIDVPGCLMDLALAEIKNAIIDFCERSLILQVTTDPMGVSAGQDEYDIDAGTGYTPIKIMSLWYGDSRLSPIAPDMIDDSGVFNPTVAARGTPRRYTQRTPTEVTLIPTPDVTAVNMVAMRVAVKPLRSLSAIEDTIYENYFNEIVAGAKYRLMVSPGKSYTNPGAATYNKNLFEVGVNQARQRAVRGYTRSSLAVRMRRI